MDLTAIVAVYAALVATAGLGWQIYSWHDRRSQKIEVSVQYAMIGMTDGSTVDAVAIVATNRSEHNVRVSGVGLDLQDGSGREMHVVHPVPGSDLPGTVGSRDSGQMLILESEVTDAGIDIYDPVTGWVRLSTGEKVRSKASPLMSRS